MTKRTIFLKQVAVALAMTFLLTSGGCLSSLSSYMGSSEPTRTATREPVQVSPLEEARSALARGDYAQAERISQKILSTAQGAELSESYGIYVESARVNKHPHAALSALDAWEQLFTDTSATHEWQGLWSSTVEQLSAREAVARAEGILSDTRRSIATHNLALAYLTAQELQFDKTENLETLESAYAVSSPTEKGLLEHAFVREAKKIPSNFLTKALMQIPVDEQNIFPASALRIAGAQLQLANPATKATAQAQLEGFATELPLADPSVLVGTPTYKRPLAQTDTALNLMGREATGAMGDSTLGGAQQVVLVLPLSGQFSAVSAKIIDGAKIAIAEKGSGSASLQVINSMQSGWVEQVKALPSSAHVVGGPLNRGDYITLKSAGLFSEKAFFAFLPSLEGNDEGRIAWRFFTSPQDQIRALVDFTTRLGIRGYGVVYPKEPYGSHMASSFEQIVVSVGGDIIKKASYTPANPSGWMTELKSSFTTPASLEGASSARYKAVFLPDTWKNTENLVPLLFQFGETRQILLGTSLWEQELSIKAASEAQYYNLALFPGAWNAESVSPGVVSLGQGLLNQSKGKPDFWHALGYDFVQLSLGLDVQEKTDAYALNTSLQRVATTSALAPLRFGSDGRASQGLFLFSLEKGKPVTLHEATFIETFQKSWNN